MEPRRIRMVKDWTYAAPMNTGGTPGQRDFFFAEGTEHKVDYDEDNDTFSYVDEGGFRWEIHFPKDHIEFIG
jgi:hypothetical protein